MLTFEVPSVSSETYEAARKAAPGYDVHFPHAEWQAWAADQGAPVKDPDSAFLGFCRARH